MLNVCETFVSISGESTFQGLPAFFIRTGGCNLRCSWCDTAYAWDEGEKRTIASLTDEVRNAGARLVVITGGEPLQQDINPLIGALADMSCTVLVETNGTLPIANLDKRARFILDVKPPSATVQIPFLAENLKILRSTDELKFVVVDRKDFDHAASFIQQHDLPECALLMSPILGKIPPGQVADWILESGLPFRLQLQLHKILWGTDVRGR